MNNLFIIVVLYNQSCNESISCKDLQEIDFTYNVIIADNSIIKNNNSEICKEHKWKYINMNGNQGISKAYNKAIDSIDLKDYWVVLLDQDTHINLQYFEKLTESIINKPNLWIKVPIVKNNNHYLSPSIIRKYSIKRVKDTEDIFTNLNLTAINTGMAIYSEVFNTIKYDERFFLDFIDHNFIRNYNLKFKMKLDVFNSILQQNFSDDKHDNFTSDVTRFKIFISDYKLFCNTSISGRMYYSIKVFLRSIKLSMIYKDLIFLKIVFKNLFIKKKLVI